MQERELVAVGPLLGDLAVLEPVDDGRRHVQRVAGNFVDNGLRYGGNEVTLEAARSDWRIELHVHDNGTGFPPEFLERAFDRFSRPDAARSSGGTGLGLSIAKAIAESHHGSAHAANRGPGGADTWISLPIPNALGPA